MAERNAGAVEPGEGRIRVRCFGELQMVRPDGTRIDPVFMLPRRAALFLYLVLGDAPAPLPRGSLAAMFWPFLGPGAAELALNEALFALRQYLGEVWRPVDNGITVVRDPLWCDVWAFRDALAADDLERATGLYRGPLLERPALFGPGEFQLWLEGERERLSRAAVSSFARLGHREARAGNWARAVEVFRQAARVEPVDETNLRCLMVALVQAGDRDGALRAYELLRRRLAVRRGCAPEDETAALAEVIAAGANPPLEPFLP